jgi:GNAT superfamily N-acetyltransferase
VQTGREVTVRLLKPGDEQIVRQLAEDDDDFELSDGDGKPPLADEQATTYLQRDDVLHWVAFADEEPVGHLMAYVQYRRRGDARQLMLYEIGVRRPWRRRGIGRALVNEMREWMAANEVHQAWVPADSDGAVDFYAACGFVVDEDQAVQMTLLLS